ncbi:hypothetical protein [Parasitella parasitica]|uniref:Uncharacterized protein n=1 Tax=Parasitella parasitica TaxID=35722 RepID=A0A0B7NMW2_9FUNG|nr:hypothetical protein [Parasitella parasitica]
MPELNIGQATFWAGSDFLAKQLDLCPTYIKQNQKESIRRLRCQLYKNYNPLPVESIFDLSSAHALDIHTEQRSDMSRDYMSRHASALQLNDSVYTVQDQSRYSYQLCDYNPSLSYEIDDKYVERIELNELRSRPETYLQFGSLFGTSRLQLHEPELIWLREHLHRTTGINHPKIRLASQTVIQTLGENYTSIHLRQGDGVFQAIANETIAQVESVLLGSLSSNDKNKVLKDRIEHNTSVQDRLKECRSAQQQSPLLLQDSELEMIYLATDASDPQHDFPRLFDRYPCIFTLDDFYNAKILLLNKKRKNKFERLLSPMIDAEIASHAKRFIGTPKSTYSAYVRYRNQHYRALDFFTY